MVDRDPPRPPLPDRADGPVSRRNLVIPAPACDLIGPDQVAALRAGPYPHAFKCNVCRQLDTLDTGEPVSVCLDVHADTGGVTGLRVSFRHGRCGPPYLAGSARPLRVPDQVTVDCLPVLVGGEAAMAVEVASAGIVRQAGEPVDLVLSLLLSRGFYPTGGLLGGPPPAHPEHRWLVDWPAAGQGSITGPDGLVLIAPLACDPPPGWLAAARAACRVGVYVASRAGMAGRQGRAFTDALQRAADAGLVVAASAQARIGPDGAF